MDHDEAIAVKLDESIAGRSPDADELALVAAYLPELMKDMLCDPANEGD